MLITTAITRLSDASARQQRPLVPQQLYRGHVVALGDDGSVEVQLGQQRVTARPGHPVQPGDLLSLRLLSLDPEPEFAVLGILQRSDLQRRIVAELRAGWPEAVALLRRQDPGLTTLLELWQRFPQQLAQLSAQLPPLLGSLQARGLQRSDLLQPARLKALAAGSIGLDSAADDPEAPPALVPLLARLLQLLQPQRQLRLEQGELVLADSTPEAARKLLPMVTEYQSEQERDSAAPLLRQLLTLNVEQSLLALLSAQLHGQARSRSDLSTWIMQLWLYHGSAVLPLELLCQQQRQSFEQRWQLDFSLQLPQAGRVEVTLLVKFPAVALRLCCEDAALCEYWRQLQGQLTQRFESHGMQLQEFLCATTVGDGLQP